MWPAAPFLEHLAHTAPEIAGEWLADQAVGLAAAGPSVLGALLRLADAGVLAPGGVRKPLRHVLVPARPGDEHADVPRRFVASWAAHLPQRARDGQWVPVIEELLRDTVDLGYAGYRAYRSECSRARAERRTPPELTGVLAREWAARLPEHDVTGLLRELVMSVRPADGTAFRWARPVRHARAGLLRHDLEASDRQPWSAYTDLETVRVLDATFLRSNRRTSRRSPRTSRRTSAVRRVLHPRTRRRPRRLRAAPGRRLHRAPGRPAGRLSRAGQRSW